MSQNIVIISDVIQMPENRTVYYIVYTPSVPLPLILLRSFSLLDTHIKTYMNIIS